MSIEINGAVEMLSRASQWAQSRLTAFGTAASSSAAVEPTFEKSIAETTAQSSPAELPERSAQNSVSSQAALHEAQLAQAAADFEAVFVGLLLQQLRSSSEAGLFGSDSGDVLGGLFDQFMGDHLAKSGSLGIAQMVEIYLQASR